MIFWQRRAATEKAAYRAKKASAEEEEAGSGSGSDVDGESDGAAGSDMEEA